MRPNDEGPGSKCLPGLSLLSGQTPDPFPESNASHAATLQRGNSCANAAILNRVRHGNTRAADLVRHLVLGLRAARPSASLRQLTNLVFRKRLSRLSPNINTFAFELAACNVQVLECCRWTPLIRIAWLASAPAKSTPFLRRRAPAIPTKPEVLSEACWKRSAACDVRCGPYAKGQSSVIRSPFGLKKQLFVTRGFHSAHFRESIRSRPRLSFEPPTRWQAEKHFESGPPGIRDCESWKYTFRSRI